MALSPKQNMLNAISFKGPEYVPYEDRSFPNSVFARITYAGAIAPRGIGGIDRWGIQWVPTQKGMVCFPKSHPLADMDKLDGYDFPMAAGFALDDESREVLGRIDRNEFIVQAVLHYGPFDRSWALVGMEELFVQLLADPHRVQRLASAIVDDHIAAARFFINEIGVDMCLIMDDLGGQQSLLMDPRLWRSVFKPELARLVRFIKERGKLTYFHCCGHVMPIVEDLIEIGVDILNPVQARANDLGELGRRFGGRIAFAGGVDSQHTLMRGSPDDVRSEVRTRIRQLGGARGGYIIGPDQTMPFPEENLAALFEEARQGGRYPLDARA